MLETILFYLFAFITVASGVGVVMSRNIVRGCMMFLASLVGVAGLYFLLHAEFLAATQLVIYVGGTLILIIFGVMLTSRSLATHDEPHGREVGAAVLIGLVLAVSLCWAIGRRFADIRPASGTAEGYPTVVLGQALTGDFLLPFELVSVVLLVVMIGAAYLAKGRLHESQGGA